MSNRLSILSGFILAMAVLMVSPALVAQQAVPEKQTHSPEQVGSEQSAVESTLPADETTRDQESTDSEIEIPDPDLTEDAQETVATLQETAYGELGEDAFLLDRLEARTAFWDFFDSEQYDLAVDAGELVVQMTEQEFGSADLEMAPVLNGLGAALYRAGRPAESIQNFERSISIYQDRIGIFSAELIDPLMGLGLAQQTLGEHDGALRTLQRAQHLTHRDKGVNNLDQVSMIQARSQSFMALDKWTEAENLQLLAAKLYRRNYGKGNVETIPAMQKLALWYHDIMDYRQARIIYRQTLKMIEEKGEGDTPAMIPALKGIASAYLEERSPDMGKGLRAHEKIVEIADNYPGFDFEDKILAHLELGDWYVMFNEEDAAWEQYRIGWDLASDQDQVMTRDWPKYFDRPHLIYPGASLSVDFMGYGVVGKEVYYDFQFTIGRDGRPNDIDVIGSNLHGQTRSAAIHAFRYARFRPRVVDGVTVATADYKVRRVYPTLPPDDYGTIRLGGG